MTFELDTPTGATTHITRYNLIEELTDRVLNWYGFSYASDYRMRPYAMLVAIEIHDRAASNTRLPDWMLQPSERDRIVLDGLTREQIEAADAATGGHMTARRAALGR
jgi:hypothetical protein